MTLYVEQGGVLVTTLNAYAYQEPASNQMSHQFTGLNLGPSSPSGLLVIGVGIVGGGFSDINGVSVNGSSATQVDHVVASGVAAAVYQITGQGGTGGTVQIDSVSGANRWLIALYNLRGIQSTTATGHDNDTAGSLSFNVSKLGVAVGFSMGDAFAGSATWSGITKDYESTCGTSASLSLLSAAHSTFTTAQAPLSISITQSATFIRQVGASWR